VLKQSGGLSEQRLAADAELGSITIIALSSTKAIKIAGIPIPNLVFILLTSYFVWVFVKRPSSALVWGLSSFPSPLPPHGFEPRREHVLFLS
jgi:hypothetical protein